MDIFTLNFKNDISLMVYNDSSGSAAVVSVYIAPCKLYRPSKRRQRSIRKLLSMVRYLCQMYGKLDPGVHLIQFIGSIMSRATVTTDGPRTCDIREY